MTRPSAKSAGLVCAQLALVLYLALSGSLLHGRPMWLAVAAAGASLGVWAVLAMRLRQLRIFPEPAHQAQLISRGPYRLIRHPMYTSLLLVMLALVSNDFTLMRGAAWLLLLADLLYKLHYEEKLMQATFRNYEAYQKKTWKLIPFVY